jgi:hypothetical protein
MTPPYPLACNAPPLFPHTTKSGPERLLSDCARALSCTAPLLPRLLLLAAMPACCWDASGTRKRTERERERERGRAGCGQMTASAHLPAIPPTSPHTPHTPAPPRLAAEEKGEDVRPIFHQPPPPLKVPRFMEAFLFSPPHAAGTARRPVSPSFQRPHNQPSTSKTLPSNLAALQNC